MTKSRAPLTIEDGLVRIAAQIGWAAMADACGQAERTVRNWSDPDTRERCPLEAAVPLDIAYMAGGGEGAPLFEIIGTLLERARSQRFADAAAIARLTIDVIREGGEAHAALVALTQPGATATDRRNTIREVSEARSALDRTIALLTRDLEADSPATIAPLAGEHATAMAGADRAGGQDDGRK